MCSCWRCCGVDVVQGCRSQPKASRASAALWRRCFSSLSPTGCCVVAAPPAILDGPLGSDQLDLGFRRRPNGRRLWTDVGLRLGLAVRPHDQTRAHIGRATLITGVADGSVAAVMPAVVTLTAARRKDRLKKGGHPGADSHVGCDMCCSALRQNTSREPKSELAQMC